MADSNVSNRTKNTLIGLYYAFFCVAIITFLAFIANLVFKDYGWAISIGIANIIFLIIVRLINVERLIGTDKIESYWSKAKDEKLDLLLSNCKAKENDEKLILTGCAKDIYRVELETVTKAVFLVKDTKGFVAGFRNDTLNLILLCTFLMVISYFGNVDFTSVYRSDPTWNKEAVTTINKLKGSIEVTVIISSVIVQLALLLRTPFLLDLRNRTYLVDHSFTEQ